MKTLHRIDFPAQCIILSIALLASVFSPFFIFMGFYIGLGIWQPTMALIFAVSPRPHQVPGRALYEFTLLLVAILSLIWFLLFNDHFRKHNEVYVYTMLGIGLVMGIWNMVIAHKEFQLARSEHQVWDIE